MGAYNRWQDISIVYLSKRLSKRRKPTYQAILTKRMPSARLPILIYRNRKEKAAPSLASNIYA